MSAVSFKRLPLPSIYFSVLGSLSNAQPLKLKRSGTQVAGQANTQKTRFSKPWCTFGVGDWLTSLSLSCFLSAPFTEELFR